jgi:solute carrier family 25 (mitochondrial S-adenosylmethionine transporter), member 26
MSSNTNTDIWFVCVTCNSIHRNAVIFGLTLQPQAGAFAAFTVDLLVYPLDTLKTRIQSPSYAKLYKHPNGTTNRALYRGLYQGVGSIILITIPSSGAFFTTYEALKFALHEYIPPNSTLYVPSAAIHSVSSAGAELVSCAILTPAEVLKQNAQVIMKDGKGKRGSPTLEVLKHFHRHPTKLWRGYTALAARNLPFTALQFPVLEHLKQYFMAKRRRENDGKSIDGVFERIRITGMSAAIAGSGAAWITTPIDVVKTRIMLAARDETSKAAPEKSGGSGGPERKPIRKSGWLVGKEVLRNEGLRGIFRGALLRSAWTAMGSGLYLGCYEGGRFYLEEARKDGKANEGDFLMKKDPKDIRVGIGRSRSQEVVKKSAWQDD